HSADQARKKCPASNIRQGRCSVQGILCFCLRPPVQSCRETVPLCLPTEPEPVQAHHRSSSQTCLATGAPSMLQSVVGSFRSSALHYPQLGLQAFIGLLTGKNSTLVEGDRHLAPPRALIPEGRIWWGSIALVRIAKFAATKSSGLTATCCFRDGCIVGGQVERDAVIPLVRHRAVRLDVLVDNQLSSFQRLRQLFITEGGGIDLFQVIDGDSHGLSILQRLRLFHGLVPSQ